MIVLYEDYGGDNNSELTKVRCDLVQKYQDIVAINEPGTSLITTTNIKFVNVALIGDPLKGEKDGK